MKEILDISVYINNVNEIVSKDKVVKIITFTGKCKSPYFAGEIQPGAVDVQVVEKNGRGTVCARYCIKGMDSSLMTCKVYIENSGIIEQNGEMKTKPQILTDSEDLQWLQNVELHCGFSTIEDVFHVKIYTKESS